MSRQYDGGASIQVAQNTGDKSDIEVYRYGRRCRLPECKKKLGTYTPGPYCMVHQHKGAMIEMEKADKRKLAKQKAAQAMLDAKRGLKPKKTWNKAKVKIYTANEKCVKCQAPFFRKKNARSILTQEYCFPCRKIERNKEYGV